MRTALYEKALLQGVPAPAGDGINCKTVISGDMCVGNDTSHEKFADNFEKIEMNFSCYPPQPSDNITWLTQKLLSCP